MRLVEAVAAEGLDLPSDLLDHGGRVAERDRLARELGELGLNERGVLFPHRLAEHICFGERDPGEELRDPHHLLLIRDHAVRRREHLGKLGEQIGDRLLAALARDIDAMHAGVERARAHERVGCDEIVEAIAAHALEHVRGERGFELEDAGGAAGAELAVGLGVVERQLLEIRTRARRRLDEPERVVNHGERREAEEVHLEHPRLLERVHVVLCDDDRFIVARAAGALGALRADGDVLVERAGGDHDAGRVHAGVAREPLERDRVVEQLLVARVVPVELLHLGDLRRRLLHRQREVRLIGDELRERVGFGGGEAEHASDVLDDGARLHGAEGDDLADRFASVLLAHVLDHLAAPLEAEVDVDVRHRDALGIEEALEEEIEAERADVGDAQRVGDE